MRGMGVKKLNITYLAIENDDIVYNRESRFWASRNISSHRVYSMSEGIKAASTEQFLFIGINAANVDYVSSLSLLRDVTNAPILISTDKYSMQEQGKALSLGADLFGQISDYPADNYTSVMAAIGRVNAQAKQPKAPVVLLLSDNILMSHTHRRVFVADTEVALTRVDFDILYMLMENSGRVLSPEQIYSHVWEDKEEQSVYNSVMCAIKRLRKKISLHGNIRDDIIQKVWGVGYKFAL